jgi:hypothetical protein
MADQKQSLAFAHGHGQAGEIPGQDRLNSPLLIPVLLDQPLPDPLSYTGQVFQFQADCIKPGI